MKLISKFQNGGLYSGQSGFYRNDKPDDAVLNFFSDVKNKIQQSLSNINIAGPSKGGAQLRSRNPQYFNKPEIKSTKPIKSTTNTSNQQTNKQTVYKSKYDKKDDSFEGGSKKEVTVTAPRVKPKTQITTPTKQDTIVNNKEEVKTAPKQTYLKPKGEVNSKVAEWQKKLKNEGFDVGKIDGKWGKKTEAAYQDYIKNKERLEKVGFPEDNVPFVEARQGFPTPESAYLKKGGKMEFIYLKKGGKINGKVNPNDGDENAIPTKEEGGTDMNPKFIKKLKPKQTTKPSPIYKPKAKTEKVEEKKKGGKMRKKCSCGCAMKISKNEKGGLIESCACGCSIKKHEKGGKVTPLKNDATKVNYSKIKKPRLDPMESEYSLLEKGIFTTMSTIEDGYNFIKRQRQKSKDYQEDLISKHKLRENKK